MFGQLLFVRIRAAEKALREGRLDEAFRLAMASDLRDHRRGQAVLAGLAEKFLARAREHYRADRFSEALLDLDRADAGGGLKDEIAELRKYVQSVAVEHFRKDDSRRRRVDDAVRRIEDGSLAAGRKLLEQASHGDTAAARVRQVADKKSMEIGDIIGQAERLIAMGQWAGAADRVRRAKSIDAHAADVIRLEAELCEKVLGSARGTLIQGYPARAADELACLGELGKKLPARQELVDVLALTSEAGDHARAGRFGEAKRCAMSAARRISGANWINEAVEQLRMLEEVAAALAAGPLGERLRGGNGGRSINMPDPGVGRVSLDETVAIPHRIASGGPATDRLLLLVDGGGSFLLIRGGGATIGRAATEHPADVPIFSDVAERHVNIQRVDEDYFAFATKEIEVGDRPTQHTLLRDGDRVVLGKKAKFLFRIPSRRSATAVLELSDTTKMPHDVRRVVLLRHAATIGCGPTAHIPCRHAGVPLVLFERNGDLWVRRQSDGHVDNEAKVLTVGQSIEIGGVGMVVKPWVMKG